MRTKNVFRFLLLGGLLVACQKDVKQSQSLSTSNSSNLSQAPYLVLNFSPNPAIVGQQETISANLSVNPLCGKMRIEQALDIDGNPTSTANAVTWGTVKEISLASDPLPLTYSFTPLVAGSFGYRTHFIPGGPQEPCQGDAFNGKPQVGVDLVVIESCDGLSIAPSVANITQLNGNTYRFTVCFTVNTCGDTYKKVKIQGGLTAGSGDITSDPAASNIFPKKQNTVLNWKENTLTGSKTYCVTFTKTLKGTGPWPITGNWSISGENTSNAVKTKLYTGRVTVFPGDL
jgi:hypothetical protein